MTIVDREADGWHWADSDAEVGRNAFLCFVFSLGVLCGSYAMTTALSYGRVSSVDAVDTPPGANAKE